MTSKQQQQKRKFKVSLDRRCVYMRLV
ncbi:hypothetical protein Goshw_015280 [Gossypium schwendimanii]|uniref:Uncharacterized protein n=1 Tax=Gossypium schwendimanii TaxID=34291 RepID=A0A7J9MC53_GOSSC|nr:hypothetical protein [Gossypium schwendimanii]